MINKLIFLIVSILIFFAPVYSQNSTSDFKTNGKPLILIFSDFHTTFSGETTSPVFEITRAYLGYEHKFSNRWNGKVVFDVGDPKAGKYQMTAFLKNDYIKYNNSKLKFQFGMVSII